MTDACELSTRPFVYDRSDLRALATLAQPRAVPWLFKIAWVLFALAFFLVLIGTFAGSKQTLPYLAVLVVMLAIYLALHRFGTAIVAWAQEKAARRDELLNEQTMALAADCFRAESVRGKTEVRWAAIPRLVDQADRLFVYSTRRQVFIIPERAFRSRDEFRAFADRALELWKVARKG